MQQQLPEITMDSANLYREEVFTDRRVGTIQRLTPVVADGSVDSSRDVVFVGQTQLMTQAGPLPLSFEIQASSIGEAAEKFGDGAEQAVQEAVKKLEDMRREAASSIIVPGAGQGGAPGGGNISMP